MDYKEYCENEYRRIYDEQYGILLGGRTSTNACNSAERGAQKAAIKDTLKSALAEYPNDEAADLWKSIYMAHLKRKAGIADWTEINEDIIAQVISADQSWKKSSGHAFESFIYEVINPSLASLNIKFVLQTELTRLFANDDIHNDGRDIEWLKQRIHTDVFDLYAIMSHLDRNYVFGCIQSKTSIRDRVTRDREPSLQAMRASFWSIAVALDGTFLALPKFQEMCNGNGEDYDLNGWHGLYVISDRYTIGRIFGIDSQMGLLVKHTLQAAEAWMSARNRFNENWMPR